VIRSSATRPSDGFTLIELLVVVLVLGILAGIAVPRFVDTAHEAKHSALASNLAYLRQIIELYKVQHADRLPTRIVTQLTGPTDIEGTSAPDGPFGPYIRGDFPNNPVDGSSAVIVVRRLPDRPTGAGGWIYATRTGELRANLAGPPDDPDNAYWDL
jgi:prepilin-type N-terminal cleavage/methylation domain-containing protein